MKKIVDFYKTKWYASLIIIFAALIILMLLEIKNHRFRSSDFKVYYRAAERLYHGENMYRPDIDGHYYYKYSPTAAMYFVPVIIFPVVAAQVLHWTVMALFLCLGFYLALRMTKPDFRAENPVKINNLLLLIALILSVHLEYEFFLGQVNHILLVLYLVIIFLAFKRKDLPAAIIWAGTIFIKPFGLIFLPYFLLKKKFRLTILFLICLPVFAFIPAIFTGMANLGGQYQHWFHELSIEMSPKQILLAPGNDTIFSIMARYTPLRLLDFSPVVTTILQASILAGLTAVLIIVYRRGKYLADNYVLEAGIVIMLIPLLSFTNHYAFQFIELAVFVIMFSYKRLSKWWQAMAVAGFIFTGMNMHDLWGSHIWRFLNDISLVSIGAILLLAVLINCRIRQIA